MNRDQWIKDLFEAIDSMDTSTFCSFLTEDCELTFGNMPTVHGRDAIFQTIDGFYKSIKGLSHSISEAIEKDENIITYGVVTYTRHDNNQVSANFCDIFKIKDDLVNNYKIFVDVSLLYA